jgi:hypothetical protein
MLIHALTSYILEVSRGEVLDIILATVYNMFAKSICGQLHILPEEVILPYWDSFARIRGAHF